MFYSCIFNCFYMFFKCFTERAICRLILLYYSTLIRWEYFFACKYSYLPILPDDNADIFAVSLLIPRCTFLSLILSSIAAISFYILSKRFFLKCKEWSDIRVVSIWFGSAVFIKIHKVFKVNIPWMIKRNFWSCLKFAIFLTR